MQQQQQERGTVRDVSCYLVPGPTTVPSHALHAYAHNYGSADLEPDYFKLHAQVCETMGSLLGATSNESVVIQVGEGMLALWSALKSCTKPGDRVLALANGIFGAGVGDMAKQIGANVRVVEFAYDRAFDIERIRAEINEFRPQLVTCIHCETTTGVLNDIKHLGAMAHEVDALLYVDFVSSAFGADVQVNNWGIDLGLLGSQKALSLPPTLSIVTVSERAWARVKEVDYHGYDALLPWKTAVQDGLLPYTFDWGAMVALSCVLEDIKKEGLQARLARHSEAAQYCIAQGERLGLRIYPCSASLSSTTVTAFYIPLASDPSTTTITTPKGQPKLWDSWDDFNAALRRHGLVVGGSYGTMSGRIFRLGHMGTQASLQLLETAFGTLETLLYPTDATTQPSRP